MKFRSEQIDLKRLTMNSLMFGFEPQISYKGHKGQTILDIIQNPNQK